MYKTRFWFQKKDDICFTKKQNLPAPMPTRKQQLLQKTHNYSKLKTNFGEIVGVREF